MTASDRWMHYENIAVAFNYVVFEPVAEAGRVVSTLLLLWGAWDVIWKEHSIRYGPKAKAAWWFLAKFAIFVVILVSSYYVALHLALAVVWVRFLKLNVIDDVATKRNHFKIATSAGFLGLSLVVLFGALHNFIQTRKANGRGANRRVNSLHLNASLTILIFPCLQSRLPLGLGALFLTIRCVLEFTLNIFYSSHKLRPKTVYIVFDIGYGLLSTLFLVCMALFAHIVADKSRRGGHNHLQIEANVRLYIINKLRSLTNNGHQNTPEMRTVLNQIDAEIPGHLGEFMKGTDGVSEATALKVASDVVKSLRPKQDTYIARLDRTQQPQPNPQGSTGIPGKLSLKSFSLARMSQVSLASNTSSNTAVSAGAQGGAIPRKKTYGSLNPNKTSASAQGTRVESISENVPVKQYQHQVSNGSGNPPARPLSTGTSVLFQPPPVSGGGNFKIAARSNYTHSIQEQATSPQPSYQGVHYGMHSPPPPTQPSYNPPGGGMGQGSGLVTPQYGQGTHQAASYGQPTPETQTYPAAEPTWTGRQQQGPPGTWPEPQGMPYQAQPREIAAPTPPPAPQAAPTSETGGSYAGVSIPRPAAYQPPTQDGGTVPNPGYQMGGTPYSQVGGPTPGDGYYTPQQWPQGGGGHQQ